MQRMKSWMSRKPKEQAEPPPPPPPPVASPPPAPSGNEAVFGLSAAPKGGGGLMALAGFDDSDDDDWGEDDTVEVTSPGQFPSGGPEDDGGVVTTWFFQSPTGSLGVPTQHVSPDKASTRPPPQPKPSPPPQPRPPPGRPPAAAAVPPKAALAEDDVGDHAFGGTTFSAADFMTATADVLGKPKKSSKRRKHKSRRSKGERRPTPEAAELGPPPGVGNGAMPLPPPPEDDGFPLPLPEDDDVPLPPPQDDDLPLPPPQDDDLPPPPPQDDDLPLPPPPGEAVPPPPPEEAVPSPPPQEDVPAPAPAPKPAWLPPQAVALPGMGAALKKNRAVPPTEKPKQAAPPKVPPPAAKKALPPKAADPPAFVMPAFLTAKLAEKQAKPPPPVATVAPTQAPAPAPTPPAPAPAPVPVFAAPPAAQAPTPTPTPALAPTVFAAPAPAPATPSAPPVVPVTQPSRPTLHHESKDPEWERHGPHGWLQRLEELAELCSRSANVVPTPRDRDSVARAVADLQARRAGSTPREAPGIAAPSAPSPMFVAPSPVFVAPQPAAVAPTPLAPVLNPLAAAMEGVSMSNGRAKALEEAAALARLQAEHAVTTAPAPSPAPPSFKERDLATPERPQPAGKGLWALRRRGGAPAAKEAPPAPKDPWLAVASALTASTPTASRDESPPPAWKPADPRLTFVDDFGMPRTDVPSASPVVDLPRSTPRRTPSRRQRPPTSPFSTAPPSPFAAAPGVHRTPPRRATPESVKEVLSSMQRRLQDDAAAHERKTPTAPPTPPRGAVGSLFPAQAVRLSSPAPAPLPTEPRADAEAPSAQNGVAPPTTPASLLPSPGEVSTPAPLPSRAQDPEPPGHATDAPAAHDSRTPALSSAVVSVQPAQATSRLRWPPKLQITGEPDISEGVASLRDNLVSPAQACMHGFSFVLMSFTTEAITDWGEWGRLPSPHRALFGSHQDNVPYIPTLPDLTAEGAGLTGGLVDLPHRPIRLHFSVSRNAALVQWSLGQESPPVGSMPLRGLVHTELGVQTSSSSWPFSVVFNAMSSTPTRLTMHLTADTSGDRHTWLTGMLLMRGMLPQDRQ